MNVGVAALLWVQITVTEKSHGGWASSLKSFLEFYSASIIYAICHTK